MHKWLPKKLTFVFVLIRPTSLVQKELFFCILPVLTRLVRLIKHKDKRIFFWQPFMHSVYITATLSTYLTSDKFSSFSKRNGYFWKCVLQHTKCQVELFEMHYLTMFITPLCVIFLLKLRWPENKGLRTVSLWTNEFVSFFKKTQKWLNMSKSVLYWRLPLFSSQWIKTEIRRISWRHSDGRP